MQRNNSAVRSELSHPNKPPNAADRRANPQGLTLPLCVSEAGCRVERLVVTTSSYGG